MAQETESVPSLSGDVSTGCSDARADAVGQQATSDAIDSAVQVPSLRTFAVDAASVSNNHGFHGECSAVFTRDEDDFEFSASLSRHNPDSAEDEVRSECSLSLVLLFNGRAIVGPTVSEYEYHGDAPGSHLSQGMREGWLMEHFLDDVRAGKLKPVDGFVLADLAE